MRLELFLSGCIRQFATLLIALLTSPACHAAERSVPFEVQRQSMIQNQLIKRGIENPRVLESMRTVPRHFFVPGSSQDLAYLDGPLPIGHGQTISQPYIVAFMTEMLDPEPEDRVLEIGTGSGYQAAVLSRLVKEVYSIEIVEPLANQAKAVLARLGYDNVHTRVGDGYQGWPEQAPFDAVIVTAAPDHVPEPLVEQLKEGGRLVIPVGEENSVQFLKIYRKRGGELKLESDMPVRFVPMTGRARDE